MRTISRNRTKLDYYVNLRYNKNIEYAFELGSNVSKYEGGNTMYEITNLNYIINKKNVTFYGYRKAQPKLHLVSFDRDDREVKRLEERLYEITGATKDNHVLFEVKLDGNILAVKFSDGNMWLGLGVEKQSW